MPSETPIQTELMPTINTDWGQPPVSSGCVSSDPWAARRQVLATAVEEDDEEDEDEPEEDEDDLDEVEDDEDDEEYDDDDAEDPDDVVVEDDDSDEDDQEVEDDDSDSVKKLMTEPARPAPRHTIH
jgi:hypothetical protein